MKRLLILLPLMLPACATPPPITANPVRNVTNIATATPLGGTVVTGLQNAAFNLDSAIAIKVLSANDPADACVHSVLKLLGQDVGQMPAPVAQFTPKVTDLISGGSVAYILAQQAKQLAANGGLAVPATCEQLVGQFVIQGVNAPANAVINAAANIIP